MGLISEKINDCTYIIFVICLSLFSGNSRIQNTVYVSKMICSKYCIRLQSDLFKILDMSPKRPSAFLTSLSQQFNTLPFNHSNNIRWKVQSMKLLGSLRNFLHSLITSSLLGPIILSIFSNSLNLEYVKKCHTGIYFQNMDLNKWQIYFRSTNLHKMKCFQGKHPLREKTLVWSVVITDFTKCQRWILSLCTFDACHFSRPIFI
jgi:hypothetical protein